VATAARPQHNDCPAEPEVPCRRSWLPRLAQYRWSGAWSPVVLIEVRGSDATIVDSEGDLVIVDLGRIRLDAAALGDELVA
jgi:hypothetical protein